jgi:hypothetical protein
MADVAEQEGRIMHRFLARLLVLAHLGLGIAACASNESTRQAASASS